MKLILNTLVLSLLIHILTVNIHSATNNDLKKETPMGNNLLLLKYHFNDPEISKVINTKKDSNEIDNKNLTYKSPWLAFLFSMFLPTTGQIYNGDYTKALIQGGLILGGLGLVAGTACVECGDPPPIQTSLLFVGFGMAFSGYAWSIIDAPISANSINSRAKNNGITLYNSDNGEFALKVNRSARNESYNLALNFSL